MTRIEKEVCIRALKVYKKKVEERIVGAEHLNELKLAGKYRAELGVTESLISTFEKILDCATGTVSI